MSDLNMEVGLVGDSGNQYITFSQDLSGFLSQLGEAMNTLHTAIYGEAAVQMYETYTDLSGALDNYAKQIEELGNGLILSSNKAIEVDESLAQQVKA